MTQVIDFKIKELNSMKKYPQELFFKGNPKLLNKRKISIVGTRRPNSYSKQFTHKIASELSKRDICIVSGAAMGIDAIAHKAVKDFNTIAVVANGLDIRYPSVNSKLIQNIEQKGLILSAYEAKEKPRAYTFVHRNEIVVSLGEVLIVSEADEKSGSLTSIKYALNMGKKVYTLPHRLEESKGTQELVSKGLIEPIYNLNDFLNSFGELKTKEDELSIFLSTFPSYDEALEKYGSKIYELEIEGLIKIENGLVKPS